MNVLTKCHGNPSLESLVWLHTISTTTYARFRFLILPTYTHFKGGFAFLLCLKVFQSEVPSAFSSCWWEIQSCWESWAFTTRCQICFKKTKRWKFPRLNILGTFHAGHFNITGDIYHFVVLWRRDVLGVVMTPDMKSWPIHCVSSKKLWMLNKIHPSIILTVLYVNT